MCELGADPAPGGDDLDGLLAAVERLRLGSIGARTPAQVELLPCGGGALVIRGILNSVGGATLRSALEPLARPTGSDDQRERERRFADALVELAGHGLDSGVIPERAGRRAHLQVTTSLATLQGLAGAPAGELELSLPIAAATVQRLACDAGVTRVLLGADSAVIDVGRSRRVPATSPRRALNLRDQGCVWPGCDRPASWTQAHHLQHWAHGGSTHLDNLGHSECTPKSSWTIRPDATLYASPKPIAPG